MLTTVAITRSPTSGHSGLLKPIYFNFLSVLFKNCGDFTFDLCFSTGRFSQNSTTHVTVDKGCSVTENKLFISTVRTFYSIETALGFWYNFFPFTQLSFTTLKQY